VLPTAPAARNSHRAVNTTVTYRDHADEIVVRLVPAEVPSRAEVDDAYLAKYGRSGSAAAMITPAVALTTLRLEPAT
jgi:hypothetical protein